ncbi:expressed unknown protein [Seminavis robusta]|uniref:Transmembrane protein n=1 Tax=Seminavis robusta TaxID=568900 RepID=A0A9N8E6I5_9STRA|nr:expressed unknown protein [Seminavis robusta]|eukprot:Sro566_g167760.1 n/a (184) ;mRNA; f:11596-12147
MHPVAFFLTLCGLVLAVDGFAIPTTRTTSSQGQKWTTCNHRRQTSLLRSSKDEEIAKLEEQLRKLKEEEEEPVVEEETEEPAIVVTSSDDFVGRGPAKRAVQPMEEMLSEAWKDGGSSSSSVEETSEGGISIPAILASIAFVVFVGFFSQVPVGQDDLSKYQAIKTDTSIDLGDINPVRSGDF